MIGFTIQSVSVQTDPPAIIVNTTTGAQKEFSGTPEVIRDGLKALVSDIDPNLGMNMFMLKALAEDANMEHPESLAGKTVTYDLLQADVVKII